MDSSKYIAKSLQERVDLIVREEMNCNNTIPEFITKLSQRLTEIMEDEIRFRRYR